MRVLNSYEKVYLKYNGKTSAASSGLSEQERKWLEKKGTIKIGYADNILPYSAWSEEKHEMIGLLSEFTSHMKERYNVEFESVRFDGCDDMIEALQQGGIDTAFPLYGSY